MNSKMMDLSGYILLLVFSLSVSSATWFSIKSEILLVFVSSLAAWLSYALAHRQIIGEMVHSRDEEIQIRGADTLQRKVGVVFGTLISLSAFPTCIVAVNKMNFLLLTVGFVLFFTGYVLIHYFYFGEPL